MSAALPKSQVSETTSCDKSTFGNWLEKGSHVVTLEDVKVC